MSIADTVTRSCLTRCILTNNGEGFIYNMLQSRDKEHVNHCLYNIPDGDRIRLVCRDMCVPYRNAAKWALPQAQVVIDKFHVVKLTNYCLDIIRKSSWAGSTRNSSEPLKGIELSRRAELPMRTEGSQNGAALWRQILLQTLLPPHSQVNKFIEYKMCCDRQVDFTGRP